MWHEDKPAVSLMPHGQCEDRKCAVPRGSHLQYEEVVQHKERVYCQYQKGFMRRRFCIFKNVTSVVRADKVCSIRRVAPGV